MPKLKNITSAEVAAIMERGEMVVHELYGMNRLMEGGYADELADPGQFARDMLILSIAAGRAAQLLLHKEWMQRQQAELERLRKARGGE